MSCCYVALAAIGVAAAALGTPTLAMAANSSSSAGERDGSDCDPRIVVLPDLGGDFADALAFNAAGTYVGGAQPPGANAPTEATYWTESGIHVIPTPSGFDNNEALDINASGEIVVFGINTHTGTGVSWVFVHGRLHRLEGLGGDFTRARRINNDGMIAGLSVDAQGNGFAVRWSSWSAKPTKLFPASGDLASAASGINQSGDVAGETDGPPPDVQPPRPAVWEGPHRISVLETLPGSGFPYGYLKDVNDRERSVGDLGNTDGSVTHAATWDGRDVRDLGLLAGDTLAHGLGIASNGWVVGVSLLIGSNGRTAHVHGIFWPGHGPLLVLPGLSGSYSTDFTNVHAVNSAGTVSGVSMDAHGIGRATVWSCAQHLAFQPPH